MKTLFFFVCSAALVFTFTTALAHNFSSNSHSSLAKSDNSSQDISSTTNSQQMSSSNSPDNQRNFTHINQNSNSGSSQHSYTSTTQTNSGGSQHSYTSSTQSTSGGSQRSYTSTTQTNSSGSQNTFTNSSQNSDAPAYQHSSLNLRAVDLRQPHILSINTSGSYLTGEVIVNGKVVKRLTKSREQINLSPLLSVGQHTVKISARYSPTSSSVNVELSGPGTKITQQDSGNGVLKYTMNVTVN